MPQIHSLTMTANNLAIGKLSISLKIKHSTLLNKIKHSCLWFNWNEQRPINGKLNIWFWYTILMFIAIYLHKLQFESFFWPITNAICNIFFMHKILIKLNILRTNFSLIIQVQQLIKHFLYKCHKIKIKLIALWLEHASSLFH